MHWYMESHQVPKSFPSQEREPLLSELRKLLSLAKMEHSRFDGSRVEFTPGDVTGYIKEVTKLWRETWLIHPLEALVARYEKTS